MAAVFVLRSLYRARHILRWPLAQLSWAPGRGHRLTPTDDELYQRTRISLLQRESPQAMYIDSYSSRGFVVNGNRVLGPCALLPHSVVQWNVGSHQDITEGSFSLFWMLEPRIEIVVVGTGDRTERLQPQVLRAMRQRGIAVEVQDTKRRFSYLLAEGPAVRVRAGRPRHGRHLNPKDRGMERVGHLRMKAVDATFNLS